VESQPLFEYLPLRPARPVPRPVGEPRTACHSAHSRTPPRTPEIALFWCMPRMSYTTKDFKSCRINTYKKMARFSHLTENTQLQVLYNQHLRVFAPQVLWIQHLHEKRGVGEGGTFRVIVWRNASGIAANPSPHLIGGVSGPGSGCTSQPVPDKPGGPRLSTRRERMKLADPARIGRKGAGRSKCPLCNQAHGARIVPASRAPGVLQCPSLESE